MSSNEQASASSSPQQQQKQNQRKPPFADLPTIKILTPPQGPFLPKVDEWCFTYCTQTVSGRINRREPNCHSLCVRKVFPHEVRNVLAYKRHHSVGTDGKAVYPLPAEGQAANVPRILGGHPKEESEDSSKPPTPPPTKNWDEGWYLWTGEGRWNFFQKTEKMMLDLPSQQQLDAVRENRKEVWHDYQEKLKQNPGQHVQPPSTSQWWAPIVPPKSLPDTSSSLLVPIPPEIPAVWDGGRIRKLLSPSMQALGILHDSITSGEQREFAERVWEKAKSEEPWILAQRSISRAYERWKKPDIAEEDDGKTGSA
ncbi:hypothetical protein BDN70DRAFT_822719 [Pholiota conissans]|uniref:Uncharacterized protein n=1 Tax=Pholiota conissans TaxID=109636 RepID=A0A9P5ZEH6_9AGAR|nr:hypothetical protein BDN70DRAFT_822719 [Pholiota conissans]